MPAKREKPSGFKRRKRKHETKDIEELFGIGLDSVGPVDDTDLGANARDSEQSRPQGSGDTGSKSSDRGTAGSSADTGSGDCECGRPEIGVKETKGYVLE